MPKQIETIQTEEEMILAKYTQERAKLSKKIRNHMNNRTYWENISEGIIGGIFIGLMMSMLVVRPANKVPTNKKDNGIEKQAHSKHTTNTIFRIIAVAALLSLILSAKKTISDTNKNRIVADKLTEKFLSQCLDEQLKKLNPNAHLKSTFLRAGGFIMNNMSDSELTRMRIMAIEGLKADVSDYYSIHQEYVDVAARIVANCIKRNPELEYYVREIMYGKTPKTYFLSNIQKTR